MAKLKIRRSTLGNLRQAGKDFLSEDVGFAWFECLCSLRGLDNISLSISSYRCRILLPLLRPLVPFAPLVCVPLVIPSSTGGHMFAEYVKKDEYKVVTGTIGKVLIL